ncbi:MAG: metallophosphoesterase [Halorientalis sp.]
MLYRSAPGPALARFRRPRTATPTSFAVFADAHVTPWGTGTWKVLHRSEQRLRTAITEANRLDVDAVVFAGDLTKDGAPREFARVDELLGELDAPFVAVPGNHDVPKDVDEHRTPPVEEFADTYATGKLPFVSHVGGLDIVGIDTATTPDGRLTDSHAGHVSTAQLDWLESILPGLANPVVVCHHNVTHPHQHTGEFANADFYQIGNARELATVLAAGGVELVVSGHIHWPATATVAGVREVIAPAICSLPPAFLHVEINSTGTTVDVVPLVDRAGFEEAYAHASDGGEHGQAVSACVDRGLLSELPVVDEQPATRSVRGDLAPSGQ